jgi:LysR family glycine cleavage system transcriptional activator
MRRLPSLSAIEAFITVARAGSIKAAAEELSLSSPAISRRIQALESHIARPLFERRHQSLVLTDDGERLLSMVAPALDTLTDAIEGLTSGNNHLRLRLGVLPLYASQRLMPRLAELRALHPNLHLDVDTAAHSISRLGEGIDVAIALAKDIDPNLYAKRLDHDRILAIGARRLAQGPHAIVAPEQIADMTVILHRDMPDTYDVWRAAVGLPNLEPATIDIFDSGQLILEAAAQGLGIAFMHESHFDDAHDDRLIRMFDVEVESPYSYWFVCRPRALELRQVRHFHDWLLGSQ